LNRQGVTTVPMAESPQVDKLQETVKRFHEMNQQSPANLKLQDL
jgi:hypothetical protein